MSTVWCVTTLGPGPVQEGDGLLINADLHPTNHRLRWAQQKLDEKITQMAEEAVKAYDFGPPHPFSTDFRHAIYRPIIADPKDSFRIFRGGIT